MIQVGYCQRAVSEPLVLDGLWEAIQPSLPKELPRPKEAELNPTAAGAREILAGAAD